MKRVYYEPAGRIHSSQWELINNPPEGYEFVTKKASGIVGNDFIFDKLRLQYLDRMMPLNYVKAKLDSKQGILKHDLIFAYNHLVFRKIPWVVLVEWANILIGRDLKFMPKYVHKVEEILSSDYCKGIITWSEIAKESILQNYNTAGFKDKIKVIPHAVKSVDIDRDYNHREIKLLFIGSANTPEDFDAKGARDVIKAFDALRAKFKGLKLTVRAKLPTDYKMGDIYGLTIIDHLVSRQELDFLFKDADIFVLPSHLCQEMILVEAMSYGLPVVTSWIGSTCGEYIEDGVTGFVLPKLNIPYFLRHNILTSETIHRHELIKLGQNSHNVVDSLVYALEQLIESPELRERLGRNGKAGVDSGQFSIEHRNKLLLEIL